MSRCVPPACSFRFRLFLLFLVVALFAPLLGVAQQSSTQQPPSSHQLTLIHPGDPQFSSLLSANFPGLEALQGYALYRPFLVLLRNDTSRAVRAYMLQWEARSFNGESFQLADRIERYDPGLASERVALAPGEMRLVSDHFDVNPKEYQSQHQHNWVATMMAQVQDNPRYSSADPNSITSSVDAAVFDDGLCVGPDHHQIVTRSQREVDAEHDIAEELLRLLDANTPEADVLAFLKRESDAGAAANASLSGSAFIYAFYRGRQAQTLLTIYHRGGIESVMTRAWLAAQRPRKQLSVLPPQ